MKKLILLTLCSAALFSVGVSQAHDENDDDSESVSRTVDLKDFDHIRLEGVYDMHVLVGESFSIDLSGREREMSRTELYLDGDTLVLDQNRNDKAIKFKNWKGVKAEITLPALYGVTVEGVGRGEFENIKADDFNIAVEGVGEFIFQGRCENLDVSLEGIGSVDTRALKCENVDADLEGMGELTVYAAESIDADAEGIGSIDVYGKPEQVKRSKDFLSNVSIK